MQTTSAGEAGTAARVKHRLGAELHGLQAVFAGAVEHAGVGQSGHDRQQGIESGVLFAMAGGAAAFELRQCALNHRRETELGFFSGTASAVTLCDLGAVTERTRGVAVIEQRQARGAQRD